MGGGKGGGGGEAAAARADEQARQRRIRRGMGRIDNIFDSQFNDDFFSGRQQAFMDYATPQLEQQFGDAQRDLTFSLARQGLTDSSVRGQQTGELQRMFDMNRQDIADQALAYGSDSRNAVEDARGDLVRTLQATGDADAAAKGALARATALSQPQNFSPLANLFGDFTRGLGSQFALERAEALSGAPRGSVARYNTGLFQPSSGAVRVR